jgi:thioredoxin-related protein
MGTTRGSAKRAGALDVQRTRRRMLQGILACTLAVPLAARSQFSRVPDNPRARPVGSGHPFNLPPAHDLAADAIAARRERIPVLLLFDRWDCPYCERLLREYLVPMTRGDEWKDRVVYRQVEVDTTDALVDFAGASITHRDLAQRYNIRFTPTVLLVDGDGKPLADPLIGFTSPDFYGAYIEEAIRTATTRLRGSGG